MLTTAESILTDRHQAEDVVQESLLKALGQIHKFEPRVPVSAWLRRIVINTALSELRSRNRRKETPLEPVIDEFDNGIRLHGRSELSLQSAEELASSAETSKQVSDTIARLPDQLRLPLLLRDVYGYTTQDTAEILEISEANVKIRLHRARTILRQNLQAVWSGNQ